MRDRLAWSLFFCLVWFGCHGGMQAHRGDAGIDGARASADVSVDSPWDHVVIPLQDARDPAGEAGPTVICDKIVAVAMSTLHACALAGDGSLWCWGDNKDGQLGDGTTESKTAPVWVASLGTDVVHVAVGDLYTCVIKRDGSLWCWGSNGSGQLGNGKGMNAWAPERVAGLGSQVTQVALGTGHTCARTSEGSIWCWGSLTDDTTSKISNTSAKVAGIPDATDVAVGWSHSCARKADGTAWCWGSNLGGQLGDGSKAGSLVPVPVKGLAPVTRVFASAEDSCAVGKDGALWCWGGRFISPMPLIISTLPDTVEVALGDEHSCARRNDGTVWCWGGNAQGQLGDGTIRPSEFPVLVGGITDARQVAIGHESSCVLDGAWKLRCWGSNDWGILGIGRQPVQTVPRAVTTLKTSVAQLSAADQSYCARAVDGTVSCWGNSFYTELGYGTQGVISSPVPMSTLGTAVVHIASGRAGTSCAVLADGGVWCWGMLSNTSGVFDRQPVPVQVSGLPPARQVAVGWGHACAQTHDGVYCWGRNEDGMVGDGTTSFYVSVPRRTQIVGQDVVQLSSASSHTCARLSDGTLWCWGANAGGQLGDGTTTLRKAPVQVTGLGGKVVDMAAGWVAHTCAVLADGTVWCWGQNDWGQLGADTPWFSPVPVPIDGLPSAVQVSSGESHICALTSGGEIWCWGRNGQGQFGNGKTEPWRNDATLPVRAQAPGVVFVDVCAGANSTCARTADGTVWCWGTQNHGLQADGALGYSPGPVAVTGCR
jgi:alpha-tubulin suppressor-like RCC1 family protein